MVACVDVIIVIIWSNFISVTPLISWEEILSLMTKAVKEFFCTFIQAVKLHAALTHGTLNTGLFRYYFLFFKEY